MNPAALAGGLRVWPGVAMPHNLQDSRVDLAARLVVGRAAQAWPGLVGSLFNLCGHAQRLCAQLAVAAAAPDAVAPPSGVAARLRAETAQEHVRRIGLDWPRLLGQPDADAVAEQAVAALRRCPLLVPPADGTAPWPAMATWLRQELLHMPPRAWLMAWRAGGADWLRDWSQQRGGWLQSLLKVARAWDGDKAVDPARAVRVPHDPARCAIWAGAHTGSWSRLGASPLTLPLTPWALLGSRIAELIALCLEEGGADAPAPLAWGALATASGQGLAWVEMARGLLLHRVVVDGATGRLSACQLRVPTDWNFHPTGEVARQLAALDAGEASARLRRRVGLLMAAFDPCVPFDTVCPHEAPVEPSHA